MKSKLYYKVFVPRNFEILVNLYVYLLVILKVIVEREVMVRRAYISEDKVHKKSSRANARATQLVVINLNDVT